MISLQINKSKISSNGFSFRVFCIALVMLPLFSCGNSSSSPKVENDAVNGDNKTENSVGGTIVTSSDPTADIEKAKKDGKAVFLVIVGTGATNVEAAEKIAKDAVAKVKNSVVIKLDRSVATNSALVTKYGIGSVQLPFVLVISPKGVPVGGYPSTQATADALVKILPSPKQDEALSAIYEKKPVFIVISKTGMTDKAAILANCKSASSKIASKPAVIEVDFADAKETAFLKQLGITAITDQSVTIVVNGTGQITDTFKGVILDSALVTSVNKVIKSGGCAPGACGSGKKC
jgi:hypothetical protein